MSSVFPSLVGGKIPALNGWRAVCILLVLLHHSKWVPGGPDWYVTGLGGLGVRFFFVISGFLITLLLLREEKETGGLDIRAFFKRRSLRILPVYYFFLAVVLVLQLATPYQLSGLEWVGNLTFTRNYFGSDWTTGHLWSLAVEQQFYLLWPFAFRALTPLLTPRRAMMWLAVPLILCPVLWLVSALAGIQGLLGTASFFLNADALAGGCALAIALWHWGDRIEAFLARRANMLALGGAVLALAPVWIAPLLRGYLFPLNFGFPTLQCLAMVVLIALSIRAGRSTFMQWLDWRWVSFIGTISYSLYMWQQVFCTKPAVFGASPAWWNSFPFWIAAAFLAAIASYYFVERPFLRMKRSKACVAPEPVRVEDLHTCVNEK